MRANPQLKTLIALATFAAITGCGPSAGRGGYNEGGAVIVVAWDPAPLDRDYHSQYDRMVARHNDEDNHPQSDESADQRRKRHDEDDKDMQRRYDRGKKEHRLRGRPFSHLLASGRLGRRRRFGNREPGTGEEEHPWRNGTPRGSSPPPLVTYHTLVTRDS